MLPDTYMSLSTALEKEYQRMPLNKSICELAILIPALSREMFTPKPSWLISCNILQQLPREGMTPCSIPFPPIQILA